MEIPIVRCSYYLLTMTTCRSADAERAEEREVRRRNSEGITYAVYTCVLYDASLR